MGSSESVRASVPGLVVEAMPDVEAIAVPGLTDERVQFLSVLRPFDATIPLAAGWSPTNSPVRVEHVAIFLKTREVQC